MPAAKRKRSGVKRKVSRRATSRRKSPARKATRKRVVRKKATRRVVRKTVRRAARRPVRKATRRTVRKAVRRSPAKKATRRTVRRKTAKPKKRVAKRSVEVPITTREIDVVPSKKKEVEVGTVVHYYTHIGVSIVDITGRALQVGDQIRIKGTTTDFIQLVSSMQLQHDKITNASKGQSIGLKVDRRVREHDKVFVMR